MTADLTGAKRRIALGVLTVWLVAACVARDRDTHNATPERGASTTVPSTDSAAMRADSARRERNASLEPGELATVKAEPVTGWTGPGGQPFSVTLRTVTPHTALFRRFGTIAMRTSLRERSPDLGQYPCTSCHLGRETT